MIFQSVHIYAELGNCYEFLISLFSKSINGMGRENNKFANTRSQSELEDLWKAVNESEVQDSRKESCIHGYR